MTSDNMEVFSLPRRTSGGWVMKKLENMGEQLIREINEVEKKVDKVDKVDKKVSKLGELGREILKNRKRLVQKLHDVGDIFLQGKELPKIHLFGGGEFW